MVGEEVYEQEVSYILGGGWVQFWWKQVQKWFHKLDFNGNGFITWEEFRVFLEQNPELLPIFMVATFHEWISY